ncbi:MAG TPA: hypothetical protein VJN65_00055 [Bacteroidota bacterium]|nr:hypothetical protein [Bacteroidota bacterium]
MKRPLVVFSAFILILLLISCSSTKDMADQNQNSAPQPAGPGVPPSHCRILGTVVKIEDYRSTKSDDPCSKAPCVATVRVEEVLGYGSGFSRTLHKAAEIRVHFRLTLGPTKEILPEVVPPLPGLSVGSRFQADISGGPAPAMQGQGAPDYLTDQYHVKD